MNKIKHKKATLELSSVCQQQLDNNQHFNLQTEMM